jgi:hypothetical protein
MTSLQSLNERLERIENHLNINNNLETQFKIFIINEYSFERMIHSGTNVNFANYNEFVKWNIKCINELSPEKKYWLFNLCQQINNKEINQIIDFVFEDTDLGEKDNQLFYRSFISVCMVYYRKHFHGKLDIKL